ncbi:hypothetical protein E2C01_082445 [Portunus trituberculatus]|uniref:Uncharacterized protein n=1 Tax=Portunus trituberculatus TaxID=210409 RepID=A0A5B7IZ54_PORTR|nr:hypothetical protein [Portunus trituberculatus]
MYRYYTLIENDTYNQRYCQRYDEITQHRTLSEDGICAARESLVNDTCCKRHLRTISQDTGIGDEYDVLTIAYRKS